jgi:hypothetical protein
LQRRRPVLASQAQLSDFSIRYDPRRDHSTWPLNYLSAANSGFHKISNEGRANARSTDFGFFRGRSGSIFGAVSMKPIIFVENTMSSKHGIFSENAGSRAFCDMFTAVLSFVYTP